jgi:hypothetical protein
MGRVTASCGSGCYISELPFNALTATKVAVPTSELSLAAVQLSTKLLFVLIGISLNLVFEIPDGTAAITENENKRSVLRRTEGEFLIRKVFVKKRQPAYGVDLLH